MLRVAKADARGEGASRLGLTSLIALCSLRPLCIHSIVLLPHINCMYVPDVHVNRCTVVSDGMHMLCPCIDQPCTVPCNTNLDPSRLGSLGVAINYGIPVGFPERWLSSACSWNPFSCARECPSVDYELWDPSRWVPVHCAVRSVNGQVAQHCERQIAQYRAYCRAWVQG